MREWVRFTHYARPWTVNSERSGRGNHWAVKGKQTKEWREAFYLLGLAKRRYKMQAANITAEIVVKRKPLPDTGANYTAIKAAIDGLVDAGLLPNDTPEHVRSITMLAPVQGKEDKVIITLEEA
jgi:crossover junction endodeoxyribonuclease RusA